MRKKIVKKIATWILAISLTSSIAIPSLSYAADDLDALLNALNTEDSANSNTDTNTWDTANTDTNIWDTTNTDTNTWDTTNTDWEVDLDTLWSTETNNSNDTNNIDYSQSTYSDEAKINTNTNTETETNKANFEYEPEEATTEKTNVQPVIGNNEAANYSNNTNANNDNKLTATGLDDSIYIILLTLFSWILFYGRVRRKKS